LTVKATFRRRIWQKLSSKGCICRILPDELCRHWFYAKTLLRRVSEVLSSPFHTPKTHLIVLQFRVFYYFGLFGKQLASRDSAAIVWYNKEITLFAPFS